MTLHLKRAAVGLTAGLLATALTGCDSFFDPVTDDVIDPSNLTSPAAIATLLNGARRDFALAYVGAGDDSQEGSILIGGLVADEYDNSDTFPTRQEMDRRDMDVKNASLIGAYGNLHRARVAADNTAAQARSLTPNDKDTIGEADVLSATTVVIFADNYCSGVPLSSLSGSQLVYGEPQTTVQLYSAAAAKFAGVVALAPTSSTVLNAARVGQGRALLGLGRFADAAIAVAAVPTNFAYTTFHSEVTGIVTNGIWGFVNFLNRWSVSPGTGGGLDFATANDPRVPVEDTGGTGFDAFTPQFNQELFPTRTSPVPIATGIEARLIQAEAALQAGNSGGALSMLNDLRATVPGLAPLADAGSAAARVDQLFSERAFWLFSTGRRLGDLRRLIRQYGRTPDSVFPSGDYYKGGEYGPDVNIPISFEERNNPNVGAQGPECLDRNP
ncbi:MAG: hypothetical protein ABI647_15295 [Gemmatimonadota bacterium]